MANNLYRSNRAHERLRAKHRRIMSVSTGERHKMAKIKADYHDDAISVQSNMGRVLFEQEKTWVWKRANDRYNRIVSNKKASKKAKYRDDFDYTPSGRIKGSYTVDGFFEPD